MKSHIISLAILVVAALLATGTNSTSSSKGSSDGKSTSEYSLKPAVKVANEHYAAAEDVKAAKEFLGEMPPACGNSSASASPDGTITIRFRCKSNSGVMSGIVKIKDGIVTDIK